MLFEFNLDWLSITQMVVAVILPVLVGLVTKHVTSSGRKALLLAALAAVTAFLTEAVNSNLADVPYDAAQGLVNAIATFVVGVALHYGLWKPTGVSNKALSVGEKP